MKLKDHTQQKVAPSSAGVWSLVFAMLSALLALFLLLVYGFKPDDLAGITIIPAWVEFGIGLMSLFLTVRIRARMHWKIAAAGWLLFLIFHVEEPRSLIRSLIAVPPHQEGSQAVRIVSMNCGDGGALGIEDLSSLHPDVVLLQESPGREVLKDWCDGLFGEDGNVLWGVDCSIIARGELSPIGQQAGHFTCGEWSAEGLPHIRLVSLRLSPPPVRFDLYSTQYWTSYRDLRRQHEKQLAEIALKIPSDAGLCLVGGDFNSPAGDPSEGILRLRKLQDTFSSAGRGWGNTITNDFPFHRIDRICAREGMIVRNVRALRTRHSDHRLVCCDVEVSRNP